MADYVHYVNTASTAGGNGTTNETSGPNRAYWRLSEWAAAHASTATALDTYTVLCCGVAADANFVVINFTTAPASVTIKANRDDPAGFYDGPDTISGSHYRLSIVTAAAVSGLTLQEPSTHFTIDGIQFHMGDVGGGKVAIDPAVASYTIRKCRLLNATGGCGFGIGTTVDIAGAGTRIIENNLVVGFTWHGINVRTITNAVTVDITHNTVFGTGTTYTGIRLINTSGVTTATVRNNAVANCDTDILATVASGSSVTYNHNATEQYDTTRTGEIQIESTAETWVSAYAGTGSDFGLVSAASRLYQAGNQVLLDDITDTARAGASHDVGAFAFQGVVTTPTWVVPTNAPNGTVGRLVVFDSTWAAVANGTASASGGEITLEAGETVAGTEGWAGFVVPNVDDLSTVATIDGGWGVATVEDR